MYTAHRMGDWLWAQSTHAINGCTIFICNFWLAQTRHVRFSLCLCVYLCVCAPNPIHGIALPVQCSIPHSNDALSVCFCIWYVYSALTDCHALVDVGHVAILLEMRRMIVHIAYRDVHIALGAEQPIVGLHIYIRGKAQNNVVA